MKKAIPLLLIVVLFLAIKLTNNSVRLSDTNTYFNIAYQMSHGEILYKNFFFSNFPLFAYISYAYYFLSGKNLEVFYFTSAIEAAAIALLIYLIIYKKTKDYIISTTSSALYILSFMILSTSDHQTGVFTASLFAVLSYLFLQKGKYFISGMLIAATVLTKAYFLPILLSFFLYIAIKKEWKKLFIFCCGFILTGLSILLPSLIQAPKQLISDIFGFSLTRPAGVSKINVATFLAIKDFPFLALLLFNLLNIRRNILFGLISIFSIIFFVGYQDVYYLYLNFLAPFICLSFYEISYFFKKIFNLQCLVIPTIISAFILLNLFTYISSYRNLGKLENIDKITKTIKAQNPKFLYGANDIAPALIALVNIPALENVNDAHEYFFTKNVYDKKFLTDKAVGSKTIVIAHGADYPEYNIKQDVLDNIFVKETIYENCKKILSVPVLAEGYTNRINLFKCY